MGAGVDATGTGAEEASACRNFFRTLTPVKLWIPIRIDIIVATTLTRLAVCFKSGLSLGPPEPSELPDPPVPSDSSESSTIGAYYTAFAEPGGSCTPMMTRCPGQSQVSSPPTSAVLAPGVEVGSLGGENLACVLTPALGEAWPPPRCSSSSSCSPRSCSAASRPVDASPASPLSCQST